MKTLSRLFGLGVVTALCLGHALAEQRPNVVDVLALADPEVHRLFTLDNDVSVRTNDEGLRLGSWQNQTLFHSMVVEPVE